MTEPYRAPTCPVCGWTSAPHAPGCPHGSPPPSGEVRALLTAYVDLRRDTIALEELIERSSELTADDRKRLDKAVTVMKVGFKLVKKVLRSRGIEGRLKPADAPVLVTPNA